MEDLQEPLLQPKSVADQHEARHLPRANGTHGDKETLAESQALDIRYTKLLQVSQPSGSRALLGRVALALDKNLGTVWLCCTAYHSIHWLQTMSQQGKMAWPLLLNLLATYSINESVMGLPGVLDMKQAGAQSQQAKSGLSSTTCPSLMLAQPL
jgi:hypothetical protein